MNNPMEINGWNLYTDNDGLIYWKDYGDCCTVIGTVWLDIVEGDEGYNKEHDCYCVSCVNDGYINSVNYEGIESSIDCWDCYGRSISDVMRWEEIKKWMFEFMKSH